jgi:Fanconi-associated nuclease 1
VPDLFIWKPKEQKFKFVEVKGPGDTPQENQRFWFDSLLRADADVEICKVIDSANSSNESKNKKKRKWKTCPSPWETSASLPLDDSEHEDPDLDYQGKRNDNKEVSQMAQDSNKRRWISGSEKQTSTETEI